MPTSPRRPAKKGEPIDHNCTSEAVCPHCGHVHSDSWEYDDSTTTECVECEKPFHVYRHTDVTYNTTKAESIHDKP